MRAMAITEFGGPDVFHEIDIPRPEAGPGEVLIRVAASSVNPVDYKIRDGRAERLCPGFPAILHADCAGTVEAVGEGVDDLVPGDEVYSFATGIGGKPGALAEYMAADATMVARKPTSLSFEATAALPLVTVTAWFCLFDRVSLKAGDTILIQGGTGGVGHIAVQLAAAHGAMVYATAGSDDKCRLAADLGAVKAYNYATTQVPDYVADATAGEGFDYVFNTPGDPSIDASVLAARDMGTIIDILGHFPKEPGFQAKWLSFVSVFAGRPLVSPDRRENVGAILRETAALVAAGKLKPVVDSKQFGFSEVGAAHDHAEHGKPTGKVVLSADW
jgi:NADPH2:quinone reductase